MSSPPPPPPPPGQYPPPGLPPPGQPPGGYPPYGAAPQNGLGTAALVCGVVGLLGVLCCGFLGVTSIVALVLGWMGMQRAAAGTATNGGPAKAGFVLGIVGTVAFVLWIGLLLFSIVGNGATWTWFSR